MKHLLLSATIILSSAAVSASEVYKYQTRCWFRGEPTVCTVVENRNSQGFLNTRNIYNNQFGYTVKSWFDHRGFMTWDSIRKKSYQRNYQVTNIALGSSVTDELVVQDLSWD
jgi:hypothetical protein